MRIIAIANKYKSKPSEVIGETDPYLAFCLDDVCMFIESQRYIEDGQYRWNKKPDWNFEKKAKKNKKKTSNSEKIEEMQAMLVKLRGGR